MEICVHDCHTTMNASFSLYYTGFTCQKCGVFNNIGDRWFDVVQSYHAATRGASFHRTEPMSCEIR
jgi:hypothetical protein